jgi:hypothetical protein
MTDRILSGSVNNERPAVPAVTGEVNYHDLMGYTALLIFSICLSNTENEYIDAKHRGKLDDEPMNKAFAKLMVAVRKIDEQENGKL